MQNKKPKGGGRAKQSSTFIVQIPTPNPVFPTLKKTENWFQ